MKESDLGGELKMSTKKHQADNDEEKPLYVSKLEAVYGPPSQEAFGTAVFYERMKIIDLVQAALGKYRYFIGELWDRYGEDAWLGAWKEVYRRKQGTAGDIVNELKNITNSDARLSIPMFLDGIENPEEASMALAAAFNDPAVTELIVHTIGDGGAMSGLLIAAFRKKTGDMTFLVFLMD